MTLCPAEAELRAYHARDLTDERAEAIRHHLASCSECAKRARALQDEHETWIERIRSVGVPTSLEPARGQSERRGPSGLPRVSGYEVHEEIRRGGQGVVYRATQMSTGREVAIKVLREGSHALPDARRRFEREIELAAGLRHPSIVTVFDSGAATDGSPYVVMEYIRGRSLAAHAADPGVTERSVLELFVRICEAVQYAHQRGVIHRDLKPSNILIDEHGAPNVLDFGLARHVPEGGESIHTATGQLAGTLPYMSPEQARGSSDAVDVRGDVYALGVILYELLTGTFPYPVEGDTIEVLRHIAETQPAAPNRASGERDSRSSIASRVDAELETILLKSLAKERDRRYQSAGELALDIRRYLIGEPIGARRDSAWYVLRKTMRRYRIGMGIAAAFLVIVAVSAVSLGVMFVRQSRLRAEAERQAIAAREAEQRAEARFNQVRDLARFFTVEFDPLIERLPGAAPARKELVEHGLRYLDVLAAEAGENDDLQFELASAYIAIGDVQGGSNTSNLGNNVGAMASYRKGLSVLDELALRRPGEAGIVRLRVRSLTRIGDCALRLGRDDESIATYRSAIEQAEAQLEDGRDHPIIRIDLAAAKSRLANVLILRGEGEAARAVASGTPEEASGNAEPGGSEFIRLHNIVVRDTRAGQIEYGAGRLQEALACYQRTLPVAQQLNEAYPDDVVSRMDLGVVHQWIGIIYADQDKPDEAVKSLSESVRAYADLVDADPHNFEAKLSLATSLSKMGEAHLAAGRRGEAETCFISAVEDVAELAERNPDRADASRLLGVSYYKMYELHSADAGDESLSEAERQSKLGKACERLSQCRDLFVAMEDRGTLPEADVNVPAELEAELEACHSQLNDEAPTP